MSFLKIIKIISLSLLSLFLILLFLFLINIRAWQTITKNSLAAKNNLELGLEYLLNRNLSKAQNEIQIAKSYIDHSLLSVNRIKKNNPLYRITIINRQINDLKYLLTSTKLITIALEQSIEFFETVDKKVTIIEREEPFSIQEKITILDIALTSQAKLNEIKDNFDLAFSYFEIAKNNYFLNRFNQPLKELELNLNQASLLINNTIPVVPLLPVLGGWPETSRFLILFQNNDELRPTGGFLGSYATFKITNLGENIDMQTGDIYHLDMPSINYLETIPPEPISKYMGLKKWYLRDANWSPDWPRAANFIEWLFYQESSYAGLDFSDLDGIIAVTPDLIADLIALTGDINLNGEIYTSDNLHKLLQYQTGVGYREEDISSWDRKDIINDLALILKERLQNIEANKLPEIVEIIDKAIVRRDLLIYFTDPNNQKIAKEIGVDGSIKKTNSDYLMIVDANLAAFKTDAVMIKDWQYNLSEKDGDLIVNLSLSYKHEGGFDWRTTRYRSYTRVLSPFGSKFISLNNADDLNIEDNIGLDKTIFGFFLSVEPGQSKTIELSYKLPNEIKKQLINEKYKLYVQRQAGSRINSFVFNYNNLTLTKNLESDKVIRIFSE